MFSLKIHHQTLISWISSIRRPLHQIPHNKWDGVFSTNLKLSDWSSSASQLGKKLAAAFQHQTEVFNLKGSWWRFDIFSCPVNPFWGLTLCTTLTIFFYPASCEKPSAFCPKQLGGPCQVTNRHLGRIRNDGAGSYFQYPSPEQTQSCCSLAFEIREEREAEVFWECWWCQILRFGGGGFLLLITSEWPHFMLPESCLWNFNLCDLLWE